MGSHVGTGDAAREIRKLIETVGRLNTIVESLQQSSERMETLTKTLIILTIILILITGALIIFE